METILLYLRRLMQQVKDSGTQTITDLKPTIDGIKTNFDEWKVPWTAGRASKLDNLDAEVSTRAPANTALSSSVWTNTRAGKLDLLSSISTNVNSPKVVKRVQRGVLTLDSGSNYAERKITFNSVNLSKTIFNFFVNPGGDGEFYVKSYTSTTITGASRKGSSSRTDLYWEVVEFY